jgi:hypothetical protein
MNDWFLLLKTTFYTKAAIIQGRLEENDIPVQVLNKQDSMYGIAISGSYEVYVPSNFKELALNLLNETISN